jgi:2-iminobutanoate/2-iminopropanoate deaminase
VTSIVRLVLSAALLAASADPEKKVLAPPGPAPVGPYSPGIAVGDFVYVSGQGGRTREGTLPTTIAGETRQTLANVKAIVEASGLTMEHVVFCQVYLTDLANLPTVERVWQEFFPKAPPARAVLGVHRLPTDIAVEVNAVAFRDLSRRKIVEPGGMMAGNRLFISGSSLDGMKRTLAAAAMDERNLVFLNAYYTDKPPDLPEAAARAAVRVSALPAGKTSEFTGVATADLPTRRTVANGPCVLTGDTYYCSAASASLPTLEAQVTETMRRLRGSLEAAGLSFANVVATNVYLNNIDDFAKMNKIYAQSFTDAPPSRTTIAPLAPGNPRLVQISVVAVK